MPLLTSTQLGVVAGGRSIQIGGLPLFNADDPAFRINVFDGWFDAPAPDAVFVPNGGGAGVVSSGRWLPKEMVYQLGGRIWADRSALPVLRRILLAGLPADQDAPIVCYGNDLDVDLQIFVRRYDKPDIDLGAALTFSVPLLATDPYKYSLTPLSGVMGVFSGQTWYRTYANVPWTRTYALNGRWGRTYQQLVSSSGYPESLTVVSNGDAESRRITFSVTGPLSAGDWWLYAERTGTRQWGTFALSANQTLVLDGAARTATLNGADVSYAIFGDWLTLLPGINTFRLVAGAQSAAFASVTALEAYQ